MSQVYEKLEKALQEFNRLGIAEQVDFQKLYLYSIITHSTAMEGSAISEKAIKMNLPGSNIAKIT